MFIHYDVKISDQMQVLISDYAKAYTSHIWEVLYPADNSVAIERCTVCGYVKVTSTKPPLCKEYLMDEALK